MLVVEGINYCLSIMKPGLGDFELGNGNTIAWLRYAGWMVTCPVLLMFLTAMTTLVAARRLCGLCRSSLQTSA